MKRTEITIEELNNLPIRTIFKVPVWDNDDFTEYAFTYCKSKTSYIYLGGGIDNGYAIGKKVMGKDIVSDANECDMPYITVYCLIQQVHTWPKKS